MRAVLCLLLLGLVFAGEAPAKLRLAAGRKTLSTKTSEGIYRLTFDPKRIPEESVRAAIRFHPYAPVAAVDIVLGACDPKDSAYKACGAEGSPAYFFNAQVNLRKAVRALKRAEELPYPPAIEKVRKYFLKSGKFYAKSLALRLEYQRTGRLYVLKQEFSGLLAERDCPLSLEHIEKAKNRAEAWRLLDTDWHNCMNLVFNKKNEYPRQAWGAFLAKYGIEETLDRAYVEEKYEELLQDE